jgi:septal ring factor EnvC (AmiA/AmiB activator)
MDTETSQKVTSSAARDREEIQSQKKQRASLREERLQELSKNITWQEIELSNAKKGLDNLMRDIAKLRKKIDKEESEQSAKCCWRGFVSSYITKKEGKPEEKMLGECPHDSSL